MDLTFRELNKEQQRLYDKLLRSFWVLTKDENAAKYLTDLLDNLIETLI